MINSCLYCSISAAIISHYEGIYIYHNILSSLYPLDMYLTRSLSCRVEKGMVRLPSHFFSILWWTFVSLCLSSRRMSTTNSSNRLMERSSVIFWRFEGEKSSSGGLMIRTKEAKHLVKLGVVHTTSNTDLNGMVSSSFQKGLGPQAVVVLLTESLNPIST